MPLEWLFVLSSGVKCSKSFERISLAAPCSMENRLLGKKYKGGSRVSYQRGSSCSCPDNGLLS